MKSQKNACETKIRFKFYKKVEFKYLSHLDISRMIIRALRRAGFKIKYSKGYHPKPKINFSLPTPLGIESLAEYADVLFSGDVSGGSFKKRVNHRLKPQLQITEAKKVIAKADNLMNDVAVSLYGFKLNSSFSGKGLVEKFYNEIEESLKVKSDFSRSIFNLRVTADRETCSIIFLKLFGYAKIFKEKDNEFFKFNNFLDFFKGWLKNYEIDIVDVRKEGLFVIRSGILKTPMEVI